MRLIFIAISVISTMALQSFAQAHGGGCRRDSPPGQCCHMDKRAGSVHCH